ncbi:MAG TPA: hypothetical protein VFQ88_14055 [Nevskiaceae bacterium]|nr:hypothetical protein [Nevskiaceae bacterium]
MWYAAAEREIDLDVRPRHENHRLFAFGSIETVTGALLRRAATTLGGARRNSAGLPLNVHSDLMSWMRAIAKPFGVLGKDVRCTVDMPAANQLEAMGYAGALGVANALEIRDHRWPVFFRAEYDPTLADLLVNQLRVLPVFALFNGVDLFRRPLDLAPCMDKVVYCTGARLPRLFLVDPKDDRPDSERVVLATLDASAARSGVAWCRVGTPSSVLASFADYLATDVTGQGGARAAIDAMIAFDAALAGELTPAAPDLCVDLDFWSALDSPAADQRDRTRMFAFWSAFRPSERRAAWGVRTQLRRILDLGMQQSLVVRQHMQTAAAA